MARTRKPKPSGPADRRRPSLAQAAATAAGILAGTPTAASTPLPGTAGAGATAARRGRPADAAEAALLALARDVAELAARGASVREALSLLARASSDPALRRGRLAALLDRDEARSLALAWAREQLRLALEDLVSRHRGAGGIRTDVPPAAIAWALLAGCEAISLEPAGDADERVEALVLLTRAAARG